MPRFPGVRRLFRLRGAQSVQREVDDELAFHLETRVEALIRHGLPRDEARAAALREFGDVAATRDELAAIDRRRVRRAGRAEWWMDLLRDARYAARSLGREPGLVTAVLLTLALGVGANTAIFTVADAVLLRPLPYREPERLVHLWESKQSGGVDDRSEASWPDFEDWRAGTRTLVALEGYDPTNVTVTVDGEPAMLRGARVTSGFLTMLGAAPARGRSLGAGDPGTPVVVVSDGFWRRQLGGDPAVVGRPLLIDGRAYEIVGVLPRQFHFAPVQDADVWLPLEPPRDRRTARSNHWLNVVGRLGPDVGVDAARAELGALMARLAVRHPESNAGRGIVIVPLRDEMVGPVRPVLLVLLGAVASVLLIACANVASLLLARALARGREIAVRAALGASRGRLVRQLLTESLMLALAGGVLGAALAGPAVRGLVGAIPETVRIGLPALASLGVDGRVLAYTTAITMLTGLAFGLVPALYASRPSLAELIGQGGRTTAGGGRGRLRDALVTAEVALTLVLLVGAGLLTRSLVSLLGDDPGFAAKHVLTARIALSGERYREGVTQQRFFETLLERARAVPGVRDAGAVTTLPLDGGGTNTFRVEGRPEPDRATRPEAVMRGVAGDYFRSMGIRIVAGRAFTDGDDEEAPAAIIVSETLARRHIGSPDEAIGARVRFYAFPDTTFVVVGVVADVKTAALDAPAPSTIYYPHLQSAENRMTLVLRAACARGRACDARALAGAVRRGAASLDPAVPVYAVRTMEEEVARSRAVFARRYPLLLVGALGALGLVLAAVGIYGVMAYAVAQRSRELGIRLALGATPATLAAMVVRHGARIAVAGIVLGALTAALLARSLGAVLYGVSALDPLTYAGVAAFLAALALAASWLPARRAAGVDPSVALRAE